MTTDTDLENAIIQATLAMIAERRSADIAMSDVAARAGTTLAILRAQFADVNEVLDGLLRKIDMAMLADNESDTDEPPIDRLFDVVMRRFDALAPYKPGLIALMTATRRDPTQALRRGPALTRSMRWVLEAAGMSTTGLRGRGRVAAMTGIYLATMRDWMKDDSPDLARTMAGLDKRLRRVDGMFREFSNERYSGGNVRPDQNAGAGDLPVAP